MLCLDAGGDGSGDVLSGVGHGDLSGGMRERNRRESRRHFWGVRVNFL